MEADHDSMRGSCGKQNVCLLNERIVFLTCVFGAHVYNFLFKGKSAFWCACVQSFLKVKMQSCSKVNYSIYYYKNIPLWAEDAEESCIAKNCILDFIKHTIPSPNYPGFGIPHGALWVPFKKGRAAYNIYWTWAHLSSSKHPFVEVFSERYNDYRQLDTGKTRNENLHMLSGWSLYGHRHAT